MPSYIAPPPASGPSLPGPERSSWKNATDAAGHSTVAATATTRGIVNPAASRGNFSLHRKPPAAARIDAVKAFLRERLPPPDPTRELVAAIVAEMLGSDPGTRVHELAERHRLTTRALQRMVRRHVGVSPKWVMRRYRLQEAAERIAAGQASDYAELAYELGYSDQSHFNPGFPHAGGRSPTRTPGLCFGLESA